MRRSLYQRDEDLSADQAARDMRTLTSAGLLRARGETKGRRYEATEALTDRAYKGFKARGDFGPLTEPYEKR